MEGLFMFFFLWFWVILISEIFWARSAENWA